MPPPARFSPPRRSSRSPLSRTALTAVPAVARFPRTRAAAAGWEDLRNRLLGWGDGTPAGAALASVLASLWMGRGAMPPRLGLRAWEFRALLRRRFPGLPQPQDWPVPRRFLVVRRDDGGVAAELADLSALMLPARADLSPETRLLTRVLAVGCLGFGHMWRDMGFASRAELRVLLSAVVPRLARRNVADMKWKKFLYRELCKSEAGYVCRSPTCDACAAYDDCFGAET